ncbi:MAG: hypothetical protein ACJ8FS_04300 [Sphingomicrobium sp.]
MSECIYRQETLVPKGDIPDPKNSSLEHVVPWAPGGSDGCLPDQPFQLQS